MPKDFRNHTFGKGLRGYVPEEVDEYIAFIAGEYRKLEKQSADDRKKLASALKRIEELTDALESADAEKAEAEELLKNARAEAESIVIEAKAEAESTAAEILREAEEKRNAADAAQKDAEKARQDAEEAREAAEDDRLNAARESEEASAEKRRLAKETGKFYENIKAFRSAAQSLAQAQTNAAANFAKDAEAFLSSLGDLRAEEEPEDSALDVDFSGIAQAIAAMRDIIVEIPEDEEPEEIPMVEEIGEDEAEEPEEEEESGDDAESVDEDETADDEEPDDAEDESEEEKEEPASDESDEEDESESYEEKESASDEDDDDISGDFMTMLRTMISPEAVEADPDPLAQAMRELEALDFDEDADEDKPYTDLTLAEAASSAIREHAEHEPDAEPDETN